MINGMKAPAPVTIRQCVGMVNAAMLRQARRHGMENAHPRLPAYGKAWIRRHQREVVRGGDAAASECYIALTGRLIDLLEG